MVKQRHIFPIIAALCVLLLTPKPSEAGPRSIRNLRCPKSNGTVEIVPRPIANVSLQDSQRIEFDGRLVCRGRRPIKLRRQEISKYLSGTWGIICEGPAGDKAEFTQAANGQVVLTNQFSEPGQWACRVVPNGKAGCASSKQMSDKLSICSKLRKNLQRLKIRTLNSKWIPFFVVDPSDPSAGVPTYSAPAQCAALCSSSATGSTRASLVLGSGLTRNQCEKLPVGYSLIGATRRVGDEAFICFDHPLVSDLYSINSNQEPGGFTLTYPGEWTFYSLVNTDAGVVCTPTAVITVLDSGLSSCG